MMQQHITVDDPDGSPLAEAHLQVDRDRAILHVVVTVALAMPSSSSRTYQLLVEGILSAAELPPGARLQAVLPAQEDLFDQVRTHCTQFTSRAFGNSFLVDGVLN